nr:MAG TPA: hypothetical protein [Caudoviricetes sp.]
MRKFVKRGAAVLVDHRTEIEMPPPLKIYFYEPRL